VILDFTWYTYGTVCARKVLVQPSHSRTTGNVLWPCSLHCLLLVPLAVALPPAPAHPHARAWSCARGRLRVPRVHPQIRLVHECRVIEWKGLFRYPFAVGPHSSTLSTPSSERPARSLLG
jgi:hypothetical protein